MDGQVLNQKKACDISAPQQNAAPHLCGTLAVRSRPRQQI
jgi:hypothetical protein